MTYGEKLQVLRNQHKISQELLAEKVEVSRMTVSRWESGHALPNIEQIIKVSEIFCVSVEYLVYDEIEDPESDQTNEVQSLNTIFKGCITLHLVGLVAFLVGCLWIRMVFLIALGIMMNVLACVFFKVLPAQNIDSILMSITRKKFYTITVWLILPVPIFSAIEIYHRENYTIILPYIIGGVIYLGVAIFITIRVMRQYRA